LTAGIGYAIKSPTVPDSPLSAPKPFRAAHITPAPVAAAPANEALRLVYEYRMPGSEHDVLDLVGTQESVLGPSPWNIECAPEGRCDVAFYKRDGQETEPLYEFEVDLPAQSVTPAPETAEKLFSTPAEQSSGV
jgi:hypothetical protein